MTTRDTIAERKQSIQWNHLSLVFQDAIRVCRRLRIAYIWIDSLCIIQDSKDDWELESSKMCKYYENSHITISASSSANGTVPFLTERKPKWWPVRFELSHPDGTKTDVFARRHSGSSTNQLIEHCGPLSSRAWVWQENVLSTRVLHYIPVELIWECRTEVCSEDGAVPRGLYSMRLAQKLANHQSSPYNSWHDLVDTYSVRQLTYETDRLPALSGVASKIQEIVQSRYLAGLWECNLPNDLCWSVDYGSSLSDCPQFPPSKYISPTWSWASSVGPFAFSDYDSTQRFEPLVSVLDVHCTVPGLNPYGQVSDGYLVLRGLMAQIRVTCTDPRVCWNYTIGEDPDTREPMAPDCVLVEADGIVKRAVVEDTLAPFSMPLPCILLGKDESEDDCFCYVMVLGSSSAGRDVYSRLGLASLASEDWFEGAVEQTIRII